MDVRSRLANMTGNRPTAAASPVRQELQRVLRPSHSHDKGLAIETVVRGEVVRRDQGTVFRSGSAYNPQEPGSYLPAASFLEASAGTVAWLGADARLHDIRTTDTLFLDLETTGWAGAGIYAFLIGAGYYRDNKFRVEQLFLPAPSHEEAFLRHFQELAEPFRYLVTFNGKAFDSQLLADRFTLHRMRCPLLSAPHFDVLFPSRRVWKRSFDNCRLITLERRVLGQTRGDDIDGALIPSLYYHYISTGRADRLAAVFRHNCQDLLSLAGLAGALLQSCEQPLGDELWRTPAVAAPRRPTSRSMEESISLGILYLRNGDRSLGVRCLEAALEKPHPTPHRHTAMRELSLAYKRLGDLQRATLWWRQMAREYPRDPWPCEELAKWYEHHQRDCRAALQWTQRAEDRVGETARLQHRRSRLEARL